MNFTISTAIFSSTLRITAMTSEDIAVKLFKPRPSLAFLSISRTHEAFFGGIFHDGLSSFLQRLQKSSHLVRNNYD